MASVELIDMQPELAWYMRPYLVDFLIEIHQQYRLRPETLFLALNIVDRYVSKRIVYKKHYQLVGCAALWIASKFEDAKDRVPTVEDLHAVCCSAYDQSAFIQVSSRLRFAAIRAAGISQCCRRNLLTPLRFFTCCTYACRWKATSSRPSAGV